MTLTFLPICDAYNRSTTHEEIEIFRNWLNKFKKLK